MQQWQISCEQSELGQTFFYSTNENPHKRYRLWGIVPVLTDVAGLYLSFEDWQLLNFEIACFNLPRLLLKPGLDNLLALSSLSQYSSWDGLSIISTFVDDELKSRFINNVYHFKSPYDGSRIIMDEKLTAELINTLKPDISLKSRMSWHVNSLTPFLVPATDDTSQTNNKIGVIFDFSNALFKPQFDDFLQFKKAYHQGLTYVRGNFDLQQLLLLLISGADLVETSQLAQDGVDGILYTIQGTIDLDDESLEQDFRSIEDSCHCYTCKNFTRAYLYHLHKQTPLLSKRLQIVHNMSFASLLTDKLIQYSSNGKLREFINNYMI